MDLIHKFLNIVLPLISIPILLFMLPLFLVFKFLGCIKKSIQSENVAGKAVLITGASSGIGEYLAYEYARRGARLALVARREDRLQAIAKTARKLGSPDVIVVRADVSKVEDCKQFVNEAVNHFGQLDHLVNNAGIVKLSMLEDATQISDFASVMDINFWGSVYGTHFAVPHLRKSKGKIIVISSSAWWFTVPRFSIYSASKASLISFYDALRAEFGSDIGITIVCPGVIESEMTQDGSEVSEAGADYVPAVSTEGCAKAIVNSACRGDRYLIEPAWMGVTVLLKMLYPEVLEWCCHLLLVTRSRTSKKSF